MTQVQPEPEPELSEGVPPRTVLAWLQSVKLEACYASLAELGYDEDVDMIIEAVPEIMDLKKSVFKDLEAATKPDCMICTNTSGLNIDEIASVSGVSDSGCNPHPEKSSEIIVLGSAEHRATQPSIFSP